MKCFIKKWFYDLFKGSPTEFTTKSGIVIKKYVSKLFEGRIISIEIILPYNLTTKTVLQDEFENLCCFYKILCRKSLPTKFYKKNGDNYIIFRGTEEII